MASWKRARTKDRDAAVEQINAAYADGQLSEDERADKVSRALQARTLGEVQQTTADLQGPPAEATPPGRRERAAGWWRGRSRNVRLAIAGASAVVLVGGTVAVVGLPSSDPPVRTSRAAYAVEVDADLVTDLIATYEVRFGTTRTYGVHAFPDWTRVHVPTDDGRARYVEWTLVAEDELEPRGDPVGARDLFELDLAEVDTGALVATMDRARTSLGVEDPTRMTVSVLHRDPDDGPTVVVNVGNEFGEDGFVVTDLAGTVQDEQPWEPAAS